VAEVTAGVDICARVCHPTFNDRNPYNGYINNYYWVDDHPLLYGNAGSLDPGTNGFAKKIRQRTFLTITDQIQGLVASQLQQKEFAAHTKY